MEKIEEWVLEEVLEIFIELRLLFINWERVKVDEVIELFIFFVGEIVGDFVIDWEIVVCDWCILELFEMVEVFFWFIEGDKVLIIEVVFVDVIEIVVDRFIDVENIICV